MLQSLSNTRLQCCWATAAANTITTAPLVIFIA